MPKYDTKSENKRESSESVSGKVVKSEPRYNEQQIVVVDITDSNNPCRYEFVYQNSRVVGIRKDVYQVTEQEWEENGVVTIDDVPEDVLIEVEQCSDEQTWANVIDVERCAGFSRDTNSE
jgi:hypothetical protein